LPGWGLVCKVKNLSKIDQIQKFDQRQKPAKWALLLASGLKAGRSVDFSGLGVILTRCFTCAVFPVKLFLSFYHLGTSCHSCFGLAKPLL
jgi:hypothetical protein